MVTGLGGRDIFQGSSEPRQGDLQSEERQKMKPRRQWHWTWRFISLSSFPFLLYWEKSGIQPSLDDLEFLALLLPPPGCWDYRHALPHPVLRSKFLTRVCVLSHTCLHSFPRQLYSDCLWRLFILLASGHLTSEPECIFWFLCTVQYWQISLCFQRGTSLLIIEKRRSFPPVVWSP